MMTLDHAVALQIIARAPLVLRLYQEGGGEPDTDEYAPIMLDPDKWVVRGSPPQLSHPAVEFGFRGAAGDVLGYRMTVGDGPTLVDATFVDGPYKIEKYGGVVTVEPVIEGLG